MVSGRSGGVLTARACGTKCPLPSRKSSRGGGRGEGRLSDLLGASEQKAELWENGAWDEQPDPWDFS